MAQNCIGWISFITNDCIESNHQAWSLLLGYLSIGFWVSAQLPQLLKNFFLGSASSLSGLFLAVWWFGDVSNLLGCILTHQLPFQTYLAGYFVFIDSTLILQYIYYVFYAEKFDEVIEDIGIKDGDSFDDLSTGRRSQTPVAPLEDITSLRRYNTGSPSPLIMPGGRLWISVLYISYILAFIDAHPLIKVTSTTEDVGISGDRIDRYGHYTSSNDPAFIVGTIFAWTSVVSYMCSRFPQIFRNYELKSAAGLSMWMFLFAVMGNVTYALSIFLESTEPEFLENALPYLIGSIGTLVFDFTIFVQHLYYEGARNEYQLVPNS